MAFLNQYFDCCRLWTDSAAGKRSWSESAATCSSPLRARSSMPRCTYYHYPISPSAHPCPFRILPFAPLSDFLKLSFENADLSAFDSIARFRPPYLIS